MATWKGQPIEFQEWHVCRDEFSSVYWEYQTTADILTVRFEHPEGSDAYMGAAIPARSEELLYDPDTAEALLLCLLQWDERFNSGSIRRKHEKELVSESNS